MFVDCRDESIRYTGRFGLIRYDWSERYAMTATATGSYFEFAFKGDWAEMFFNMKNCAIPYPHIYIGVDDSPLIEAVLDYTVRIKAMTDGIHTVKVIYKSAVEEQHRWYYQLVGKLGFCGYEAEDKAELAPDNRKTIEFVGDSITEGVLIQQRREHFVEDCNNRPWQDDVTGTYAWRIAEALNLRPFFMGYGAVGLTHGGNGAVPKAADAYPFNFDGNPVTYPSCDYIMLNHGTNDWAFPEEFKAELPKMLKLLRDRNPKSKIIYLTPFCGCHKEIIPDLVKKYNEENNDDVLLISTNDWIPPEPLHPLRDGHKIVADKTIEILKENGIG